MDRGRKLTALLVALLMLFQSAAFAMEQTGGISIADLNNTTYGVIQDGAETLAAQADVVLGIGKINAEAKMCTKHYLPGWDGSELIATLSAGTFVEVYAGEYNGALSGAVSGTWMKVQYSGQTGYVQMDYISLCGCENAATLEAHTDSCPEKEYVKYICRNSTAQELYDNWESYSDAQKEFILTFMSWEQQTKLEELNKLLAGDAPLVDQDLSQSTGGSNITVSGSLPEGTQLQFWETSNAKTAAISGMLNIPDGWDVQAFDISLRHNSESYQPEGKVRVSLSGIGNAEAAASENYAVEIYHFLDTAEAVQKALADGTAIEFTADSLGSSFDAELAASGKANTIYYQKLSSMDYEVSVSGTNISFETDSFSTYYVASGTTKTSETYAPFGSAIVVMDAGDASKGTTKIYAMPGTSITFYAYSMDSATKGTWSISGSNNAKLDITKMPASSNHECTIIVPDSASPDTDKYTRLKVTYTVNGYTYTRYADIYVASLTTVVKGAINSWSNSAAPNYVMYLTCLADPINGIPGEPGINERQFNVDESIGSRSKNPAIYIKLDEYVEAVKKSYDATNTLGVVDDDGLGTAIKDVLNFTPAQWDSLLVSFARAKSWDGTQIRASDGTDLSQWSDTKIKANYVLVPYILKLQTANGYSFNLDCYIKAKNSYTLIYDINLPEENLVLTNVQTPDSVVKKERFTQTVATAKYGSESITVDKMINLQDNAGNNYRYVFLGWDTKSDGTGTRYLPGGEITVPPTGWKGSGDYTEILYAQWARVGDLKITKTVKKEYAGDILPNDSFTFRITVPKGGSYPYTVCNSNDTTVKTGAITASENTVALKNGQYVIVKDLPVGNVQVEEIDLSANYTSSWTAAQTPQITPEGETTITCTNTYKRQRGTLKIVKTGSDIDPEQVFVFKVTKKGENDPFYVTITGTSSVTIKDVAAGTYTVEELESWSWRYEADEATKDVIIAAPSMDQTVTFDNSKTEDKWLDDNTNKATNIRSSN